MMLGTLLLPRPSSQEFPWNRFCSLPLEVTQHLHTVLFEGCGLGRFRAFPFGTSGGYSADPPVTLEMRFLCNCVHIVYLVFLI